MVPLVLSLLLLLVVVAAVVLVCSCPDGGGCGGGGGGSVVNVFICVVIVVVVVVGGVDVFFWYCCFFDGHWCYCNFSSCVSYHRIVPCPWFRIMFAFAVLESCFKRCTCIGRTKVVSVRCCASSFNFNHDHLRSSLHVFD